MKKRTAILFLLCATALVIGICALRGTDRPKQEMHQAQQTAQTTEDTDDKEIETYCGRLTPSFDALLDMQTDAAAQMQERRAAGDSDREILTDFVHSIGDSIQQLADVPAPDSLSEAQRHFAEASDAYNEAAEQLDALLEGGDLDSLNAKLKLAKLLPTAMDALDEVKAGIQTLEGSGAPLPDSAKQLEESLDTLVESGIEQAISGETE